MRAPRYDHLTYDILAGDEIVVRRPDVLIVEGLNVLQPAHLDEGGRSALALSDFFDFSIYVDAHPVDVRRWYVERFLRLRETAFAHPDSYFRRYADLTDGEAVETAERDLGLDQRAEPGGEHPAHQGPGHPGDDQGSGPRGVPDPVAQALIAPATRLACCIDVCPCEVCGRSVPAPRIPYRGAP